MGRLPDQWAGRKITMRVPYAMPGELTLTSLQTGIQFPDATFSHNIDKPFEVHRVKPVITGLDNNGVPIAAQSTQEIMQQLVRIRVTDLGKGEVMTKSAALIATLIKGSAENTWEWAEPYTIVRAESFQVVADALSIANFTFTSMRLALTFEGFLLVVAPPSESR